MGHPPSPLAAPLVSTPMALIMSCLFYPGDDSTQGSDSSLMAPKGKTLEGEVGRSGGTRDTLSMRGAVECVALM